VGINGKVPDTHVQLLGHGVLLVDKDQVTLEEDQVHVLDEEFRDVAGDIVGIVGGDHNLELKGDILCEVSLEDVCLENPLERKKRVDQYSQEKKKEKKEEKNDKEKKSKKWNRIDKNRWSHPHAIKKRRGGGGGRRETPSAQRRPKESG